MFYNVVLTGIVKNKLRTFQQKKKKIKPKQPQTKFTGFHSPDTVVN